MVFLMPLVDLFFPVLGDTLPTDHAYLLYAALSRRVPRFHDPAGGVRFAQINGQRGGKGQLVLFEKSRLRLRLPPEAIPDLLLLSGKSLEVGEHRIRLGVPHVAALTPAVVLVARIVTFKHATAPERFLEKARQELDALGIQGEAGIPRILSGNRQGEPRRQVIRIKGKRVIGFAMYVEALTAEESVRLQEEGVGGRRRMGCGFFVALRKTEGRHAI
jgi:CRISPR-associated protein Cas6